MVSIDHSITEHDTLPGQVFGYWLAPWAEPPLEEPAYRPTGSLLLRLGQQQLADGVVCLDLVSVDYSWLPLSEAGRYTYSHAEGLLRDEPWRFVSWRNGVAEMYVASYTDALDLAMVAKLYGQEAADRCRSDYPAVQLKLRSHPPTS